RRGLTQSLRDLAVAGGELAHNTAQMAACESRAIVKRLTVRLGVFFVSLMVVSTGLLLVIGGLALLLEQATGMPRWLTLMLFGLLVMGGAAFAAVRALRQLGNRD